MKLHKLIIGLYLIIISPWGWADADDFPAKAIVLITNCYNQSVKEGEVVAECIEEKFKSVPNPLGYSVRVHAENPNHTDNGIIKIVMISDNGYIIYCLGRVSANKLVVNSCASEQGEPLTPAQELSIDAF